MKQITAIRESILNAEDTKTLNRNVEIANILAEQLDEIPEATKRRWKLAEKRASERLQKQVESSAAKAKKVEQRPNTKQRKGKRKPNLSTHPDHKSQQDQYYSQSIQRQV